jgi:hypothetical protein
MGTAKVGQAVEDWNLENTEYDGRLLSAPRSASRQTGFEDADHWLTGSPDFVVLPKGWNRPHLIETKTKDREVILDMVNLRRSYDAGHARQARGYLGIGHHVAHLAWPTVKVCKYTWRIGRTINEEGEWCTPWCPEHHYAYGTPDAESRCMIELQLQPMTTASLIYFSRERPGNRQLVAEFLFEHDEAWFQSGLAKLEQVQAHFIAGSLPPHPFGGKEWSQLPCQWCKVKKHSCKPDQQAGVGWLKDSKGNSFARDVYDSYDPKQIINSVITRWTGKNGMRVKMHDDDTHIHRGES